MAESEIDVLKGTTLHLQTSQPLDISSMFGVDYNRLFGGVQVRTVALHPRQPIVAVAALGMLAEFDLPSRCKYTSVEVGSTVVCMSYTFDASMLICLTAERGLMAFTPGTLRRRTLLEPNPKSEKVLAFAHLAICAGPKPLIFFCQHGSAALRLVQTAPPSLPGGRGTDKQGTAVKMESKKNLVGLAAHPTNPLLLFTFAAEGLLTCHACNVATRSLSPVWALPLEGTKGGVTQAQLCVEAHPFLPGGALIGVASNAGSVSLLEMLGRGDPRLIGRDKVASSGSIVAGLGFNLATSTLMSFMKDKKGQVHVAGWQLVGAQEASTWARLSLEPAVLRDVVGDAFGAGHQAPPPDQATLKPDQAWKGLWVASPPWAGSGSVAPATEDVVRVHLHRMLGTIVLQWRGRSYWEGVGRTPIGQLDVADAAGARRLLSLGLLEAVDAAQVAASLGQPAVAASHTGLDAWSPPSSKRVAVPQRVYLIDNGHLSYYSSVTDKVAVRTSLPRANANQQALSLQLVVYSTAQAAWLLFFRVMTSAGPGSRIEPGSYQFTLLFEADTPQESEASINPWLLPGVVGAFAGPNDEFYAVLSNSSLVVKVYATKATTNKPPAVRKLEVGLRGALGIFPGPAWSSLPKPGQAQNAEGNGTITWVARAGALCLSDLTGSSEGGRGFGSARASLSSERQLALQPGEGVLQVAWQSLLDHAGDGAVLDDSGEGKASVVGAILTSRRLLIVSATLRVIAATPASCSRAPITSFLWAGPALLFCNSSHQVRQLAWDGNITPVCSLGGGPPGALAAALPDRLLVARGGHATGHVEVSARYTAMLQPLLLGWASLASRGILPGGLWRARRQMNNLMASYDSSMVTADLLRSLVAQGFSHLALALSAADAPHLSPSDVAAVQAGAGHWKDAVQLALSEYKRSIYYPGPPAPGSGLKTRLVALGRATAAYGQVAEARQCWEAAGQWSELFPLLVMQADFASLEGFAQKGPPEARTLAEALYKTAGGHYTRVAGLGASAITGNWQVGTELQSGTLGSLGQPEALDVAPSGAVPSMEAVPPAGLPSSSDALGYVPHLDPSIVEAYIGVGQGAVRGATVVRVTDDRPEDDVDGGFMEPGPLGTGGIDDGENQGAQFSETAAQAAARAAFSMDKADNFYSSDEEGEDTQSISGLSTTHLSPALPPDKPKFKVVIREKEEAGPSEDAAALKSLAQNLRLREPSRTEAAPTFKFKRTGTDASFASDSGASELSPRPSDAASLVSPGTMPRPALPPLFPIPTPDASKSSAPPMIPAGLFGPVTEDPAVPRVVQPLPAPVVRAPAAVPPLRVPGPGPSPAPLPDDFLLGPTSAPAPALKVDAIQQQGIRLMEAGQWDEAAAQLGAALAASEGTGARSAYYLAAVKLLKVAATAEKGVAARLYRFAASLPLDEAHRRAVVTSAAARNHDVGNYGYAGEQFLWLATQASGNASDAYLAQLQQKINECDAAGGQNADIPKDEDLSVFPEIVGVAQTPRDVDECVGPLLV